MIKGHGRQGGIQLKEGAFYKTQEEHGGREKTIQRSRMNDGENEKRVTAGGEKVKGEKSRREKDKGKARERRNSDQKEREENGRNRREIGKGKEGEIRKARGKGEDRRKGEGVVSKSRLRGSVQEKPAGKRTYAGKVLCPVYRNCGGCQLLHLTYQEQLIEKKKMLEAHLKGICPVKGMIGMENPYHYRNKVHAVFGHDRKGNAVSGVYREGTHILVPVESCLLEDQKADEIIGTIRGMLKSFKIRTFDEDTGYGLLRHVLVKRGFVTGEIMVVLVTSSPVFPSRNNFVKALRAQHPEITTIIQNVNNRSTSMVLGDREHVLFGKGYIEDELCGLRFRISSRSFYQINPVQTEVLYQKAFELAGLTGKETVIDAYCGIGTIGIAASRHAGKVIGVELNPEAVRDAVRNAKINEVENTQFYCNDAGHFMASMAAKGEKADVVFMDPPRSGSTEEFIAAAAQMRPDKIIYISCGPETLARDLMSFRAKGYRAAEGWGVDMFGWTRHVESVIMMRNCGLKGK